MSSCVKVFEDALPGPQALLHHLVCQIVLAGVGEPLPRVILACLEIKTPTRAQETTTSTRVPIGPRPAAPVLALKNIEHREQSSVLS